jgi:AsmA protein
MNKAVKWVLVIAGSLAAIVVIAVIVLSMVIDVEKYKPQIEQQVAKATGRSFRLGGDLKPSFFPWIGVRLSDLHLGNPSGFKEPDFVSVESFEVRVKLLPLLSRSIEVKRFVMNQPTIVLERRKDGSTSWAGLGQAGQTPTPKAQQQPPAASGGELPITGLVVEEFAITDGLVVWIDQAAGVRKEVEQINLALSDVSLDKPVGITFSALADKKPVSLTGSIGPVGSQPGKEPLPLDIALRLLDELDVRLKGRVDPSASPAGFDLALAVSDFSPRKLMERLGQKLPLETTDPAVLSTVGMSLNLKGTPDAVAVSDGTLRLDDSRATFSAKASEFAKPNLSVDLQLDAIDLDRYLPPATQKGEAPADKKPPADAATKKTDYGPLRRLVMDARLGVGDLKVKKARMQNIEVRVVAHNGIIQLDPLKLDLYQGSLNGKSTVNVQKDQPATRLQMGLKGVQAGTLVKEMMAKELIEGALNADLDLRFDGDGPDRIRQTLGGKGDLRFNDGAIVGIDLADMVRNVQTAFGLSQKPTEKPRTDFSELLLPFTITDGLFKTDASRLNSPLLRVLAAGRADLARETLDFRVEPKFVATLKGQGDAVERAGVQVPVLISGSFAAPTFKPDLTALLNQQLPDKEALKQMIPPAEDRDKMIQEGVKGLFKKFGNQ